MSGSQPIHPPLMKEFLEACHSPLNIIYDLKALEVLCRKCSFDRLFDSIFPKILILREDSSAENIIKALLGFQIPSGFDFPIVLKYTTKNSVASQKIALEFYAQGTHCKTEITENLLWSKITELIQNVPEDKRCTMEVTVSIIQQQVSALTLIILPQIHSAHSSEDERTKEMKKFDGYVTMYTSGQECLYLNILSCSSDMESCLSRKIINERDCYGKRTLTVFTKLHLSSRAMITELTKKRTENPTPFGYFFLVDDQETTEKDEADANIQDTILSNVDRAHIGFTAVSKNLVVAMLAVLLKPSSRILGSIDLEIEKSEREKKKCEKRFVSLNDAIPKIMAVFGSSTVILRDIFINQEYGAYRDMRHMHASFEITTKILKLKTTLQGIKFDRKMPFLLSELHLLADTNHPGHSTFIPRTLIKELLDDKFSYVFIHIDQFVTDLMSYIREVVVTVLTDQGKDIHQLEATLTKIGTLLVASLERDFKVQLDKLIETEKQFTCSCRAAYFENLENLKSLKLNLGNDSDYVNVEGLGDKIRVDHLRTFFKGEIERAFELKKEIMAYWEFLVERLLDNMSLSLNFLIIDMLKVGIEEVIEQHFLESFKQDEKFRELEPGIAFSKSNLDSRIETLKNSKEKLLNCRVQCEFLF